MRTMILPFIAKLLGYNISMTKTTKSKLHDIIIIDDLPPEDIAMLQALYSRDPGKVKDKIAKVKEAGPGKFMARYYVGYGHKSIGDCGTTTIFSEQISILAAKVIQDWPLYNGQESSTRYLDFSKMEIVNPIGTKAAGKIQEKWMKIYNESLEVVKAHLKQQHPCAEGENPSTHEKAINARAFDICRSLLPAGVTTMVAWHTNLRQSADHLKNMRHHPLNEIKEIAEDITESLKEKYPNSFSHEKFDTEEKYMKLHQYELSYAPYKKITSFKYTSRLDLAGLKKYKNILSERPKMTELPHQIRSYGDVVFEFPIDFGSYRDLQRHRSAVMPMPLLTTKIGFHPWYLEQFPKEYAKKIKAEIQGLAKEIQALKCSDFDRQYYIAMGFQVGLTIYSPLPSAIYISELRSGPMVHPTIRPIAQMMSDSLKKLIPYLATHADHSPDAFMLKRGLQDIVEKAK